MANQLYLNADGSLDSTITDLFAAVDYLTISSGAITVTKSAAQVDTQSSAATDDLDTITMANVEDGKTLFIRSAAAGRTVVLKHQTGNIYSKGGDVRLTTPEQLAMLIYSGSNWVVIAGCCGGGGDTVTPIDPGDVDPDNTVPCVAAARMVEYLTYIIDAAKAEISNARVDIVSAFGAAIGVVQPAYSSPAVMTLAGVFDTTYADATAVDAAFDSAFYTSVQGILNCADADEDGVISAGELATVYSELAALSSDEADIIASVIAILGAAGLSNAIGLSTTTAGDCGACNCLTYDFTANDGGFAVSAFNGFWETANGWRTGATAEGGGYSFQAVITLGADFDVVTGTCDLAGGLADAYVYFNNAADVTLYTWTITSGGSGTSTNSLPVTVSGVRKIYIKRGVITGSYTGPAYITRLELCDA